MAYTQDQKLGTQKISTLVFKMAIPSVIAQLINVLYNIVDRMYIGHIPEIGATALTGLGISFPIVTLIAAFSAFVGSGGAPLSSIELGMNNPKGAEKILGNGTFMLLAFSVILTVIFTILKEPLLYLFGASESTIVYANEYIGIYILGTIFVQLSLGLNMFISSQGHATTAMLSVLIGAIANIILDPILIFGFNMGVRGAAIATVISQTMSAIWVVAFLISKKSGIRLKLEYMKPDFKIIGRIAALGISPFIMSSTESLITIVFNRGLLAYGGDLYVGSMTILQSVMQLFVVPTNGFAQGVQPIISYNFGAGNSERVKKAFKIMIFTTFTITIISCIATTSIPTVFAKLFTSKPELIQLVGKVMPIYMAGMWMFGIQIGCQSTFIGLGQAKISVFLALLRKVILLIPLAIILPRFIGVNGIFFAESISDLTAGITTGIIFLLCYKKIISKHTTTQIKS